MTREEIAEPLAPCSDRHCILAPQPRGPGMYTQGGCMHIKERGPGMTKFLMALGGEIVRLRALPVLATCGECGWATDDPDSPTDPGSGEWCGRDERKRQIRTDAAPPSWCQYRGKR